MAISHPAIPAKPSTAVFEGQQALSMLGDDDALGHGEIGRPYQDEAPDQGSNIAFEKTAPPLPARIKTIMYINRCVGPTGTADLAATASRSRPRPTSRSCVPCTIRPASCTVRRH